MKVHALLEEYVRDSALLKDGESVSYRTQLGNGVLELSSTLSGNYLKVTASDGVTAKSAGAATTKSDVDLYAALREVVARLLIEAEQNVFGVVIARSANFLIANCDTYSSRRVPEENGEKAALRMLAVDIVEYLP